MAEVAADLDERRISFHSDYHDTADSQGSCKVLDMVAKNCNERLVPVITELSNYFMGYPIDISEPLSSEKITKTLFYSHQIKIDLIGPEEPQKHRYANKRFSVMHFQFRDHDLVGA